MKLGLLFLKRTDKQGSVKFRHPIPLRVFHPITENSGKSFLFSGGHRFFKYISKCAPVKDIVPEDKANAVSGKPIMESGEVFMSIIISALICGTGMGLVFSAGGSTGGTDIIAAIINKYKHVSIGAGMVLLDLIIVSCSYFIFHNVDKIVLGLVEMGINSYMLDRILNANTQSVQFLIFSRKYDEIVERIIKDLGRGCTILNGEGGYSHKPMKVIVLIAKRRESVTIFRLIKSIDSQAFISQSVVRGVYGEGFDPIKA